MVTVAEFEPVAGKNSKVSLTSLQWILTATEWASAAVAAPSTRPTVISTTAAIFVFGLMSPPFDVTERATSHRYTIGGKGSGAFVPRPVGQTSNAECDFVGLPRRVVKQDEGPLRQLWNAQ
jgi:hypothetical protein